MELVDTHAHLNFPTYDSDQEKVIQNAHKEGVTTIINVGVDVGASVNAIALAKKYSFIFATVGIHPKDTPTINIEKEIAGLEKLVEQPKVVAVGECGLDFYREVNDNERKRQLELFQTQIQIALENNLPLIVHSRQSWPETLACIKKAGIKMGVFHSWTYEGEITKQALAETDFYFAVNGIITFKNAGSLLDSVRLIPQERLLVETDCPFLTPAPHRGLRNEPAFVKITAERVAELKKTTLEGIATVTTNNALKLFNIEKR